MALSSLLLPPLICLWWWQHSVWEIDFSFANCKSFMTGCTAEEAALCIILLNLLLAEETIPAYKPWIIEQGNQSVRWEQAQGLDGLMARLTAGGGLISQYTILFHLSVPHSPHSPLHSSLPLPSTFLSSVPPLPLYSCITPIYFLWASHCPIPHYPPSSA